MSLARAFLQRLATAIDNVRFHKVRKLDISIISNNCIAGLLYHHFGCRFMSPTINLQMSPDDFILFCERLDHYCSTDIRESHSIDDLEAFKRLGGTNINFPVGKLEDLTVFFQHYDSFTQARERWRERMGRINWQRLFLVLVDTGCSEDTVHRFFELPYEHKLFLTSNKNLVLNPMCVTFQGNPWFESDWLRVFNYFKWFERSSV